MSRPTVEVADILHAQGDRFLERNRSWLGIQRLSVLRAITRCRTAALGGHLETVRDAAMRPTLITPALWGVFSNGEFGLGIDAGLAFSTISRAATHHKLRGLLLR